MQHIKNSLDSILKHVFAKQHPLLPEIISNWDKIVGSEFSTKTTPLKIINVMHNGQKINILHLQAINHPIALEMTFQKMIIIERIATYLGLKSIYDLKIMVYNDDKKPLK